MSFLDSNFLYFMVPPFLLFVFFVVKNGQTLKGYFAKDIFKKVVILGDKLGSKGRNISLLVAIFCMIVALGRPISEQREVEVQSAKSTLIVALDISRSMLVNDVYPNRLEFAKNRLLWLVDTLTDTNIGIVAFAKDAFLVSPATLDRQSLAFFLENLSADMVSRQGTDVSNALKQVSTLFGKNSSIKRVLVVSDGGDSKDIQRAIKIAQDEDLQVSVMIVGTAKGGVIKDTQGLVKDRDGNIVISKRNETMLRLSEATKGVYVQEFGEGEGIKLLKKALFEDKKEIKAKTKKIITKKEWFMAPLLLGLFCIVIALHGLPRRVGKKALLLLFLLFGVRYPLEASWLDFYHIDKAEKAVKANEYEKALSEYEKLESSPQLTYNKGVVYYKNKDFKKAINEFQSIKTKDQKLSFQALYNLGNSYVKDNNLQKALKAYESALELHPKDEDTIANIEYVKKRLKEQQKEQQNSKSQMQNKNKKSKDSKSQSDNQAKKESQKGKTKKEDKQKDKEQKKSEEQEENSNAKKEEKSGQKSSKKGSKKGNEAQKKFSMSEQEAKKWEDELLKFKPKTKPTRLGRKSDVGDDIENAW